MQTAYGDERTAGGGRRQGWVLVLALPQPGQETRDIRLGHLGEVVEPGGCEVLEVTAQITAVRRQRVGGETPLDSQVVEVRRDGAGGRRGAQPSAAASGVSGIPCASATGA
ncbi:MAG: hypothetical protein QOJ79_3133 [Actinomycetota bacterium]|jgi:hypothetical protein|nr:hypothetical protein [Actinomycetota bacterium]